MRSLTVPVSLSSLLFPTVWPCLSFSLGSFPSFAFVGLGSAGAGVGCCGSCCCANAGATATSSPISSESAMLQAIPFCLLITKSNYLLADGTSHDTSDDSVQQCHTYGFKLIFYSRI